MKFEITTDNNKVEILEHHSVLVRVTGEDNKGPVDIIIKTDHDTLSVDLVSMEGDVIGDTAVDWDSLYDPDYSYPGWMDRVDEMSEREMAEIWDYFIVSATGAVRYSNLLAAVRVAQSYSLMFGQPVDVWHLPTTRRVIEVEIKRERKSIDARQRHLTN